MTCFSENSYPASYGACGVVTHTQLLSGLVVVWPSLVSAAPIGPRCFLRFAFVANERLEKYYYYLFYFVYALFLWFIFLFFVIIYIVGQCYDDLSFFPFWFSIVDQLDVFYPFTLFYLFVMLVVSMKTSSKCSWVMLVVFLCLCLLKLAYWRFPFEDSLLLFSREGDVPLRIPCYCFHERKMSLWGFPAIVFTRGRCPFEDSLILCSREEDVHLRIP